MTGTYLALLALAGLAIGSFVNVVAYRVPIGKSIVRPPSTCPGCGELIRPRDSSRRVDPFAWVIVNGASRDQIQNMAVSKHGMRTLRDEGIRLVEEDATTIAEVVRHIWTM